MSTIKYRFAGTIYWYRIGSNAKGTIPTYQRELFSSLLIAEHKSTFSLSRQTNMEASWRILCKYISNLLQNAKRVDQVSKM